MDFLQSVAHYYIHTYEKTAVSNDWRNMCFVFPSHRAGVFFKEILRKELGNRVVWGAPVITLDDFIAEEAKKNGLRKADNITLAFELYEVYREVMAGVEGSVHEFDRFYTWSSMFLGDFDDIDKYLANAEHIFTNVADYKEIYDRLDTLTHEQRSIIEAFWGITFDIEKVKNVGNNEEMIYYYQRFFDTYKLMNELYKKFRNRLKQKGLAYSGMLYRTVAENFSIENTQIHYAIIGFNALTRSEEKIFDLLIKDKSRVDFFWDYNKDIKESYGDEEHGPGRFIRKYVDQYRCPSGYHIPNRTTIIKPHITKFAYSQGQVAEVTKFINQMIAEDKITERTAIVLTDENMLLPVLSALPLKDEDINNKYPVNVTMGYPLKFSPEYGLVDLLARLHSMKSYSIGNDGKKHTVFYHKFVMPILQHPCIHKVVGDDIDLIVMNIINNNIITIADNYEAFDNYKILKLIFKDVLANEVAQYINDVFDTIFIADVDKNELSINCTYTIKKLSNRFNDLLLSSNDKNIDLHSEQLVFSMFNSVLQGQTVDLRGEPLKGLQIMGILETRAIDFDNLIILDLNEGIFPKKNSAISFIPNSIRKAYCLPTHDFHDSIFSYYFFRLISRTENLHLLYTECSLNREGKSRFLHQLTFQFKHVEMNEENVATHNLNVTNSNKIITINKTEDVMKLLNNRFSTDIKDNEKKRRYVLSPSSLSNYIKCPLLFYFANVMRIDEADEISDEADQRQIGNIFHKTMENLYESYVGENNIFSRDIFTPSLIEKELINQFNNEIFKNHIINSKEELNGRNIITFEVIKELVNRLITAEEDSFVFIKAEDFVFADIDVNGHTVTLGGSIDRQHIDKNGNHCVIDYKTGHTGKMETSKSGKELVDLVFDSKSQNEYKAVLQTLIYCYMLYRNTPKEYYPGVIYLKSLINRDKSDTGYLITSQKQPIKYDDEFDALFKQKLFMLVTEIYNTEIPFENKDSKQCCNNSSKCRFYSICHFNKL